MVVGIVEISAVCVGSGTEGSSTDIIVSTALGRLWSVMVGEAGP